jgi:hypothetical protein
MMPQMEENVLHSGPAVGILADFYARRAQGKDRLSELLPSTDSPSEMNQQKVFSTVDLLCPLWRKNSVGRSHSVSRSMGGFAQSLCSTSIGICQNFHCAEHLLPLHRRLDVGKGVAVRLRQCVDGSYID